MSDLENKVDIDDASTRIELDEDAENTETTSEGNVNLSSTKNTENSAVPKSIFQSAVEGSGDDTRPILLETLIPDKIESELKGMAEEFVTSGIGKGSGDYSGSSKAGDLDDIKVGDAEIDLNEAKTSKTDVTDKNDDNDSFHDETELKQVDEFIDNEDEDMKLRWDDDDCSNQSAVDVKGNPGDKNDDILSEEQLLEEPSDVTNENAEMQLNEHLEGSESNLEDDIFKDISEDKDLSGNRISKVVKSSDESKLNSIQDVTTKMAEDKNITNVLEDKLLDETDMTETIKSPEIELSAEESLDNNDISILEDKLLEESDMNIEPEANQNINEQLKKTENAETVLLIEVSNGDQTKKDNEGQTFLAESETETELELPIFKMPSFTETILDKVPSDNLSTSFRKEADSSINSGSLLEKNTESSKVVTIDKNVEDSDDVLLEEKLLEETESDAMEVDDEKEGELLKDDESQDGISTPMNIDKTDPSIEDQVKTDDKIINIDKSELEIEGTVLPAEHVNTRKTVNLDEITDQNKDMDQTDDQAEIADTVSNQPIEDATKTLDTCKDMTIEEQSRTKAINEVSVIGDVAITAEKNSTEIEDKTVQQPTEDINITEDKINEQTTVESKTTAQSDKSSEQTTVDTSKDMTNEEQSQTEIVNKESVVNQVENNDEKEDGLQQPIDDINIIEGNNRERTTVETITTAQSDKSSEPIETLTVPETLNVKIEKSFEKEIQSKLEVEKPGLTTEAMKPGDNLDKKEADEISANTVNPNNTLDENYIHKDTPTDSCLFLEDSPINIKTDHGLHKPDVMLEIPTQELIDMDDTDFSMNLDQSEIIDSTNDVDEGLEPNENVDKEIPLIKDEKTIDEVIDDVTANDKSTDEVDKLDTVVDKLLDPEETTEKTVEKAITDTENDKSEGQEAIVTIPKVSEVQMDVGGIENDKKVDSAVDQNTIEENMEIMFANDPVVAEAVEENVATTSQLQPIEQPSTVPQMTPDTSDEVPEISDSLGLLAESAGRMMEDDEEIEDDDDGDDDDDFDHYESSNQISAEQSEDSNPAALEAEPADQGDKDVTPDPKDEEFQFSCDSTQDTAEKMDVEEFGTLQLQGESLSQMNEEAKSAVDSLLKDNVDSEQVEAHQEATEQMDIETVKLSDTSDNEIEVEPTVVEQSAAEPSKEVEGQEEQNKSPSKSPSKSIGSPKQSSSKLNQSPKQSPSKMKNLAINTQVGSVLNIVDLEESSSSEDDIQEVQKQQEPETTPEVTPSTDPDVTNVNIPTGIDIMCTSGGSTSEITTKEGEVVISGVPKPPPHKPARLNTSEVSIKTASTAEPLVIPETTMNEPTQEAAPPKHKLSLEIFSLDSDEEDNVAKEQSQQTAPQEPTNIEPDKAREPNKCINYCCTSDNKVSYKMADAAEIAFYDAGRDKKRRSMVCLTCADVVVNRTKNLIQGIKDMTPLLELDMAKSAQDLVEISDSESEDEEMAAEEPRESIGEKGAEFVEENLAKFLNDTWKRYDMDNRLKETQNMLDEEIEKLEQDSKEIDAMLNECQAATDKLRNELYATFEVRRQQYPALVIYDMPDSKFIGLEELVTPPADSTPETVETRQAKRRLSSTSETPAKRPAIPLGYAPLDAPDSKEKAAIPGPDAKIEDDKDVSVVKLSAEAAPAELPPPGEISRPPLRVGMPVYAMKNAFGPWLKGKVLEIQPKNSSGGNPFSMCRVKFDHKTKTNGKVLPARCIAYSEPADVRMTIGTRLIALFKDSNKRESYYSGVVAEIPNPVNNYRYLVFFDDGYAQYVQHQYTRLVCESSSLVWEEVHPFSREFVREYLMAYPERPMVRLHEGQHLKTEWNGKWWSSRVTRVDASLAQVMFVGDGRREWIYRGSTRLAPLYLELRAAERHRVRPMPRSKAQPRLNMPYVEYTRSDEPVANKQTDTQVQQQQQQNEEIRRQRAVAKKSTTAPPPPTQPTIPNMDSFTSRVVYYTPKNAVRPLKLVPHRCSPKCKRNDVLSLKELRTYNPLAKPLLSGWERQIVRFKGHKEVMYRAPCGRRVRNMSELHYYLRHTDSDLPVDLFDFHYSTHCLAEFVLSRCLVGKKDLSHGKENVPVPCVNYYDDSLPEFCSYNTERTPTAGVPLNLAPEFLCGCDCTDDCQDKSKCACWKMTLEGARTIGLDGPNVGYVYKRLPEPLPSGIYECNSRCKCRKTCLNRVAQHPLQLKLQVFKTPNRGWGIRALNDVPKGSFLCVYAGNLLTDATANLDGLNEGDEYLAELDYIEVVEQMKEGYEEDIPEADKKLDKKEAKDGDDSDDDEPSSSDDEETASKTDKEDDDFRPGYIGLGVTEFNKRLRKREKAKKDKGTEKQETDEKEKEKDTNKDKDLNKDAKETNADEDCITISDDEEVREPSRFMVQENMKGGEYISKYKSVRTLFGKDEACYIMDAKVQGNIGRYLNHSCCPNVFVQNVFVDTHDPRFPWVAFFALSHIKAGTELTWNYNYDVGSVPGKVLYCYCGAPNCRGRLL